MALSARRRRGAQRGSGHRGGEAVVARCVVGLPREGSWTAGIVGGWTRPPGYVDVDISGQRVRQARFGAERWLLVALTGTSHVNSTRTSLRGRNVDPGRLVSPYGTQND